MTSKRDVIVFWDLMGSFASMHEHFPTIHTAQVIEMPESFGVTYFAPITTVLDPITEPEFEIEKIHVDVAFAFMWSDDQGPFQISTVVLGFGPRTNKLVHKPVVAGIRYDVKTT